MYRERGVGVQEDAGRLGREGLAVREMPKVSGQRDAERSTGSFIFMDPFASQRTMFRWGARLES